MPEDPGAPDVRVTWMGRPIEGVVSVDVEDHDQLIDKATIVLDDGARLAATQCYPEEIVTVAIGWQSQPVALFEGVVVEGGGEHADSGHSATIVAYDFSVRMHRERRPHQIAKGATLSSVVTEVASRPEYKFAPADIVIDIDEDRVFERTIQHTGLTDLQFLQTLAKEHQCRSFVEYNEGRSKFYFKSLRRLLADDPSGTLKFCPGFHQLLEFRYQRIASGAEPERNVTRMDERSGEARTTPSEPVQPERSMTMPEDVSRDLPGVTTRGAAVAEAIVTEGNARAGQPDPRVPRGTSPGGPSAPEEADWAVRRDPTKLLGIIGEGLATGNPQIRGKSLITIIGISPWYEGNWYVKVAKHSYQRGATLGLTGAAVRHSVYRTQFVATR